MMPTPEKKKPAEVYITRPDGTEHRIVRTAKNSNFTVQKGPKTFEDEDTRVVAECAPYTASFNNLLRENRPQENPQRLVNLIHTRMHKEAIPLSTETYNLLMKRLVRFTDDTVFSLYEELKTEGTKKGSSVRPDLETYRILFRACERGALYYRAFHFYQQMREIFGIVPDTYMYNVLLGFCTAVHDVAQATFFVEEMKEIGVVRDSNTYNCFMSCLVDAAPYEETLKTFREMTDSHVPPTVRTYNTVLKAACGNNDYDRGFQIFEEMKKMGQVPNVVSYNMLLCLCEQRLDYVMGQNKYAKLIRTQEQKMQGKSSLVELTMVLLYEMEKMGVRPNTFSYNRILSVLYACSNYKLFGVFDKMVADADAPRNKALFGHTTKMPVGGPVSMDYVLRQEEESEYSANRSIKDDGIDVVFNTTNPQDPCSISGVGVLVNKETFILMLRACLEMGYIERCKRLAGKDMKARGVVLDREVAFVLWDVCAALKDEAWADAVLAECKERNVRVDTVLYNKYLGVLAAVGSPRLLPFFSDMQVGIHVSAGKPDTTTYNTIVRGHMVLGQEDEAFTLIQSMFQPYSPVKPDEESYCLLIDLCERKKDAEVPTDTLKQLLTRPPQRKVEESEDSAGADGKAVDTSGGAGLEAGETIPLRVCHRLLRLYVTFKDARIVEWFKHMKAVRKQDRRGDKRGAAAQPETVSVDGERYPAADAETYSIVMRYYLTCKQYDHVKRLFEEIKTSNTLDLMCESYEVMLDMFHELNDLKSGKSLFDDACMCNMRFNLFMYNKLLDIALHGQDERYLVVILQDMKTNGVALADSSLAILLATELGRHVLSEAIKNDLIVMTPV
ncbi:hypothetical protein STCU_08355 [Strigomonas culicis]|uniref:Pentacotripeptide-repeat region of PRORP domain-containing protein n=1 Tax=Strigomonas culicis TaxID=28005 RepID=S9VG30_9TRYP|nr:hypothetical protein STCU_08355 [Strigomonas culicis]|eukprot:EPY22085.1 hypothetical protein STCU_08355 [Strigomonas culicis]